MIIDELFEGPQLCPECGGISFSDLILAEKKDACYYKVKASAKVWPSAYASGRLVQCRKKGAANYGKSKTESIRDPNEMSGVNSMRKKLGNIIKQAAQDDEVAYNASKLYRELWNIYGGDIDAIIAERSIFELEKLARELVAVSKQGMAEGKVKLYTDPSYFGAEVDDTGFDSLPVVNIPTNRLVGFEPDSKMQQPKAMANVKNILAGLEQGDNIPPILVRKYKTGYQVLDGHHRFWAYKVAKKDSIPARVVDPKDIEEVGQQGMAEQQELDEKWSQKYKKSINCANPRGFSQRAHCAGRKKNEDVAEAGPSRRDPLDYPPLEGPGGSGAGGYTGGPSPFRGIFGRSKEAPVTEPQWNTTKIPGVDIHTGPPPTITKPPNINKKIDPASDVPAYVRQGVPDPVTLPVGKPRITVRPGETQSQAIQRTQTEKEFGQFLQGQSGQTFGAGAGRGNVNPEPAKTQKFPELKTDTQVKWDEFKRKHGVEHPDKIEYDTNKAVQAMSDRVKQKGPPPIPAKKPSWKTPDTDIELEGESRKKRSQPEVDYDDEYDAMVARVKKLAGLGPLKTVYDPTKRQYRNMPTAQQPKK